MSFFSEVLGSIGTGQSPAPPKPAQKPPSTNPSKGAEDATKLVSRPAVNSASNLNTNGGKRKAEGDLLGPQDKSIKPNSRQGSIGHVNPPTPAAALLVSKATSNSKPEMSPSVRPTNQPAGPKPPPKGSFADIMARARLAQEQKGQSHVGIIMHQAASKEKVSKLATKRREEDGKANHVRAKTTKQSSDTSRSRKRSTSPIKKPSEAKTIKTPRPPLAAPASTYKGTMGQPARRPSQGGKFGARDGRRSSKYDEYLGTDEEDDLDDEMEGDGGEGSDASSDMEAGAFDIDEEERLALKKAKEDDARELALENKLKQEKEERRKRLQALADKKR